MSQAPHVVRGARWGLPFGKAQQLEDTLWDALTDSYTGMPMAITAENLAEQYEISRAGVRRVRAALAEALGRGQRGRPLQGRDRAVEIKTQEGRRCSSPSTSTRARRRRSRRSPSSPPVFKKDGVVTAGNASGICDGAGRAGARARKEAGAEARPEAARALVSWGVAGCDPKIMGIGPAPAIRRALDAPGIKLADFDLVEVNEAFAPQYLAVEKELGSTARRTNVDGGAIALGHPLGASGARITTHLVYELRRRGEKLGIGSACIGGGQGIAVIVEAV